MQILNVKNPASPTLVKSCDSAWATSARVVGNRAYTCAYDPLSGKSVFKVLDVTNPANPIILGRLNANANGVFVKDTFAFLSTWSGLQIVNVAWPATMHMVGNAGVSARQSWVAGNYAYLVDQGLKVVDLTDPTGGIMLLADYYPADYANGIHDVALAGDYACLASDSGLQIISAATPGHPTPVGTCAFSDASVVDVKAPYAYVAGWSGLSVVDISNPGSPIMRGTYPGGFQDLKVQGNYAYLAQNQSPYGLLILNVANPTAPESVGLLSLQAPGNYTSCPYSLAVAGTLAFALADYGSTYLFVADVADPANPQQVSSTAIDNIAAYSTGLAVNGNLVYVAAHQRGLLIYDVANPAAPVLRGQYCDTLIWATDVAVNGDYAVLSSLEHGIYVVDVSNPAAPTLHGYYRPEICDYYRLTASNGLAYIAGEEACDFSIVQFAASRTPGWARMSDLPGGPKNKKVKDGGCLADKPDSTGDFVYGLKGNNTCEFYKFDIAANIWATKESIPAVGRAGKKKAVKKGAAMAAVRAISHGVVCEPGYAVKGNNTLEFWLYDPRLSGTATYPWSQEADVPSGAKAVKEGAGMVRLMFNDSTPYVYLLKGSGTYEFYRYDRRTDAWATMASAPRGTSGKSYKNGSCLAHDGARTIYALKGSYNEFFSYSIDSNVWTLRTSLPMVGSGGKKKKVKDGAALAYFEDAVYALKGGNTRELWRYDPATGTWTQLEDMPLGGGKLVKGGGALTAGSDALYAFKGNNTLEFWSYCPVLARAPSLGASDRSLSASKARLMLGSNPARGMPGFSFSLPQPGEVSLKLYDLGGRLVATLAKGRYAAGSYSSFTPHASSLAQGIYILRFAAPGTFEERKLVIVE
jgi:hypothetical protein